MNAIRFAILTFPVIVTLALTGAAAAQQRNDRYDELDETGESVTRGVVGKATRCDVSNLATFSLQDAIQQAVTTVPGRVLEAELEVENGCLVYEVSIAGSDQTVTELTVDANSGTILVIQSDDADQQTDDNEDNTD